MTGQNTPSRSPLSRDRILRAAVELADRKGLDALTMRRLGSELGVEAMSLYKHVANKDEILDGIIELVVGEIEIPAQDTEWKEAMRIRARSAREVLSRHSWAIGLLETRGPGGPTVRLYLNAILGTLRSAGFSIGDAAHAFWLVDSYVYGHVVQETSIPLNTSEVTETTASSVLEDKVRDEFPYLAEAEEHARTSEYSFDQEFEFGLELILDALEKLSERSARGDI